MCVIVDANFATLVFCSEPGPDYRPVWEAIVEQRLVAVHGGRLTEEYGRIQVIRRLLLELGRRGSLRKVEDAAVQAATAEYEALPCQSDDPHILGLAKASGARLLCSHDQGLHADFTNVDLLRPEGASTRRPAIGTCCGTIARSCA